MATLELRLAALETAVERLLADRSESPAAVPGSSDPDAFWVLEGLSRRHREATVVFAGTAVVAQSTASWQWGVSTKDLQERDWNGAAPVFEALAHPVRLYLLQRILNGTTSTAELAADDKLGTTGQLHHHLRILTAAGWLQSVGRGQWAVPPPRVIPLLIAVLTATSH